MSSQATVHHSVAIHTALTHLALQVGTPQRAVSSSVVMVVRVDGAGDGGEGTLVMVGVVILGGRCREGTRGRGGRGGRGLVERFR